MSSASSRSVLCCRRPLKLDRDKVKKKVLQEKCTKTGHLPNRRCTVLRFIMAASSVRVGSLLRESAQNAGVRRFKGTIEKLISTPSNEFCFFEIFFLCRYHIALQRRFEKGMPISTRLTRSHYALQRSFRAFLHCPLHLSLLFLSLVAVFRAFLPRHSPGSSCWCTATLAGDKIM